MTRRWLGLALFAEGLTDHRFLDELLRRTVSYVLTGTGYAVDVSPMHRLVPDGQASTRAERIASGAVAIQGAFHLLFIHADGSGDADAARANAVIPGIELVSERLGDEGRRSIAVVPVRETETRALADAQRLRETFGTTRSVCELGVPRSPATLEALIDPKETLARALKAARPGRRARRRPSPSRFLDRLGETVSIDLLRTLPAFDRMLEELKMALAELGFIEVANG